MSETLLESHAGLGVGATGRETGQEAAGQAP